MVNISIDVTDLGGEARPGDKVVFWRPRMGGSATHAGRVISTAPVTVFLTDGKATVSDVEPGEMTVLLQCRGVESQGPVTVGVPDGGHTVTLRALLESQFEYAPPIVSAVQEAASNASASEEAAIQAQVRSEAAADRADAKVDDAINNGADLIRNEVKQDADRAVSARQAATQSESNAAASENAAASSASNAKTSETNAKTSETNAGDYAAVATTAATEAVDAMESASDAVSTIGDSVSAAAGHADRAEQYESGAAAYAQNASDAADRVGTAEQVGTWAQQAQDAADRIGTAETVEGWANSARDSASTAAQSETKAKEYRDAAFSAASSTADELRGDLSSIASEASRSASRAKTSETNAATHEANSLSAAERAEFAAEETIQQVEGDFATRNYVDAIKPDVDRGNYSRVLSTSDAEVYDTIPPGDYSALTPFFTGIGLPSPTGQGTFSRILTNYYQDGASKLDIARWVLGGKVYEYYRTFTSSGWSDWIAKIDMDTLAAERERSIPDGADWDTITEPGEYRRISTLHTGTNLPTTTLGVLQVHSPQHRSGQVTQTFYGAGGGGYWHRAKTSTRWTPWIRMDVIPESPDAPSRLHAGEARRETLVELGKRKRGGVIGTGGLPAVALRFDHHLSYFDEKVLPLLRKYRLPWMQAINAGNMGKGNDTWSAAKLAAECHRSGGEVYNHGLDHSTYTTDADADRQITGGLTQLTSALPSLHIDGWAPYGSFPQGAYEAGKSAEDFYSTYPGQLILAQHAFVRSYLPGQHERLAGPQMIGGTHSTIDKDTTGAAIRGLKAAMARGMGITFMLHPVYLDQEGYMSTTQLDALLAEIAAKRDAGELRVLSCTGIMLADKARPDDFNLLGTLSEPNATGSESVNSRGYAATSGVPHEAEVWVKGTGQVTLKVEVASPTNPVTAQHQVTLGGSAQRLSTLVTPPNDTTGITVSLTGNVQHTGVKYRPI